jgi:hypothetical protein
MVVSTSSSETSERLQGAKRRRPQSEQSPPLKPLLVYLTFETSLMYCGIFAQSKNCGARETAVARERLCTHTPVARQWLSSHHVIAARKHERNNRKVVESGVFCAVRAEAL